MIATPVSRTRFRPGPPIDWPGAFGRRFALFIDVEEAFDWSAPFTRAARSVAAVAALPAMHARLAARGIAPVYLVDHPAAVDAAAAATLRAIAATPGTEIGAQLHPWVNPPHEEEPGVIASFAGNLPRALEAAKLDALCAAVTAIAGRAPRVFRAGRYGLGPDTLALLAERGFRADTSMRAYHDYRAQGGPDFRRIGAAPFRVGATGASGAGTLIELPPTTVFTGALRRIGPAIDRLAGRLPVARGALARLGLLSRVPLTPEGTPPGEAIAAIGAAAADGARLLCLSFHSPSLVPGNTPYVRDAAGLAAFHAWWDRVLPALDRAGYAPASFTQILAAADEAGEACQRAGASATPAVTAGGL